jgi:uncharacterized protein (TIGR02271 family)
MAPEREDGSEKEQSLTRHEERLNVTKDIEEIGSLRLRKHVESGEIDAHVPRGMEHAQIHHAPAGETDSGEIETLPDGSISVPVFEEELVISRRLIVRERIVITKQTVYQPEHITEEVRRERIEVEEVGPVAEQGNDSARTDARPEERR